jgi:predicted nuclease of predicted toxin-antitoxin system
MKVLLDQGLPRSAAKLLRDAGIDAVHAGECGLATSTDAEILDRCNMELARGVMISVTEDRIQVHYLPV